MIFEQLKNKKIVVVGASGGMGSAITIALNQLGAKVIATARTLEKLDPLPSSVKKEKLDVSDSDAVKLFFDEVGEVDHVILAAANFYFAPFKVSSIKEARNFFDTKFWGQYYCARFANIHFAGSIIFLAGNASRKPAPELSCAAAINGALEALTRTLSHELKPVRVNVISPGPIDTPVWNIVSEKEKQELFNNFSAKIPAGRVGTVEDIVNVMLFLLTNTYVSGQSIYVDGGEHPV